ncbi:hypothetical protein K9M41_01300, partial [Candidatus Gracilibacteria bacterium]|nr:hypothetical protein [Candidatus Gracilibacteria bacterium]
NKNLDDFELDSDSVDVYEELSKLLPDLKKAINTIDTVLNKLTIESLTNSEISSAVNILSKVTFLILIKLKDNDPLRINDKQGEFSFKLSFIFEKFSEYYNENNPKEALRCLTIKQKELKELVREIIPWLNSLDHYLTDLIEQNPKITELINASTNTIFTRAEISN